MNNELIQYNPRFPTTLSLPNAKILNTLDKLLSNGADTQPVNVGDNTAINCKVFFLDLTDDSDIALRAFKKPPTNEGIFADLPQDMAFTEFDRAVLSAVASLSLVGNEVMTPSTIYRVLAGITPETATQITDEQLREVRQSIAKMSLLYTYLDYTPQAEEYKLTLDGVAINKFTVDGMMLSPTLVQVHTGGHILQAYKIPMPPIYEYSSKLNQIIAIPSVYLTVGGSDTPERIAIRLYMLRRILANTEKMQDTMLYSTLYEKAGIPRASIPESRLRKFIHKCLDEWLAMNVIASYSINAHPSYSKVRYHSITFTRPEKEVT